MAWRVAGKKGIYASLAKAVIKTSRDTVVPCPKFSLEEKLRILSSSVGQIKRKDTYQNNWFWWLPGSLGCLLPTYLFP